VADPATFSHRARQEGGLGRVQPDTQDKAAQPGERIQGKGQCRPAIGEEQQGEAIPCQISSPRVGQPPERWKTPAEYALG